MPAKAVVVLSGTAPPREVIEECEGALVIAADGGGNHLAAWGRVPDVVVGDMDSIRPEVLAEFEKAGARVERHPASKLHTDGALALDQALASGANEIVFAGATGGRLDQTLANVQLLRRGAEEGRRMRAVEDEGLLWTVTPPLPLTLDLPVGRTVSVIPLTDRVEGVRLDGFRYPLEDARMESGKPYGVSNVTSERSTRVSCTAGVLAVVAPRTL